MSDHASDTTQRRSRSLIALMWLFIPVIGAPCSPTLWAQSDAERFRELLDNYCVGCHDKASRTGGLNLEGVDLDQLATGAETWEKVVHKLRTGEMPPSDAEQPPVAERRSLHDWLVDSLDAAAVAEPNPGRPAVYRLNRAQYANAIRDLLAVEITVEELLPTDASDFGFDNIADSLTVSPMLMDRYLLAASKVSRLAIGDPNTRATVKTYEVARDVSQAERMGEEFPFGSRGGISVRHHFPLDGEYVIKIKSGIGSGLEVRVDGVRVALFEPSSQGKNRPPLEVRFGAEMGTRPITISFLKQTTVLEGIEPRGLPTGRPGYFGKYPARVHSFEISGPHGLASINDQTRSRQKIFWRRPSGPDDETRCAEEILGSLARRAYRRPIVDRDVAALMEFYEKGRDGGSFDDGIRLALKRILVDPEFLFRVESDPPGISPDSTYLLSDLELASRLSFFLWSSIPDDELLTVAERGELRDPQVLQQQVRRMLTDRRIESLVTNFTSQWLYLRNLRAVAPDPIQFPEWGDNLIDAMKRETELFLSHQIREDRPVPELLTADYTFLNERLARHYRIPHVYGSGFRRVELVDEARRGLLGHASILTLTSYPTRTSPVKRGKWLLENILGSPPPPPPPNVPALPESDEMEQPTTVRERVIRHRENPVCASCHVRMDPLGFALEEFDAIGMRRTIDLTNGLAVDSTAIFPDGSSFRGPSGLRAMLLEQREEVVRTATTKMLTYALGRGVEYYDQPAIREIVREAANEDYRWSSIVLGIVKSTPFQMRRSGS